MDYSELPKEIVEKIASHLDTASQVISFSCVCKSWRSAAIHLRCPAVLLVPETAAATPLSPAAASRGQIHDFVSLPTLIPTTSPPPPPSIALPLFPSPSKMSDAHGQRDRYLRLHQEFITSFPVIGDDSEFSPYDAKSDAHSLASKDGWILRSLPFHGDYRGRQLDLYLLNPFTGASIPLPPLKREYADVSKAIFSNSPDHEHSYVFTFSNWRNNLLAWCKVGPGGGRWTFPPKNCLVRIQYDVPEDASYSNGNLYLAGENALWVVHDILKPFSAAIGPIVKAFPFSSYMKSFDAFNCCAPRSKTHPYLCHLDGGQVRVILPDCKGNYYGDYLGFRVFKLVDEGNGLDRVMNFHSHNVDRGEYWEEVWSLDGHAVFIGAHQSFSFPTSKGGGGGGGVVNRNVGGIRGDHIYFALNRVCWDMKTFGEANWDGVFDVANQKFQRFADERYSDNRTRHPIFWFIPVPWGHSKSGSKHQKRKKRKGKKQREETGVASRVIEDNLYNV
ncbi:unnamed protein product [Linum trigynum]|uniref:F-box domain-containing protein n=1 Tax=Linum trigynum TaxID=586398 RepID=A0AAV2GCG1_9ROSI